MNTTTPETTTEGAALVRPAAAGSAAPVWVAEREPQERNSTARWGWCCGSCGAPPERHVTDKIVSEAYGLHNEERTYHKRCLNCGNAWEW